MRKEEGSVQLGFFEGPVRERARDFGGIWMVCATGSIVGNSHMGPLGSLFFSRRVWSENERSSGEGGVCVAGVNVSRDLDLKGVERALAVFGRGYASKYEGREGSPLAPYASACLSFSRLKDMCEALFRGAW